MQTKLYPNRIKMLRNRIKQQEQRIKEREAQFDVMFGKMVAAGGRINDLERQLENMTKAYNTATKMVAELQEFVR